MARTKRKLVLLLTTPVVMLSGALVGTSHAAEVKPTPPAAGTTPTGLSSADAALMRKQDVLDGVVRRLLNDVSPEQQHTIAGFGGVTMDPATSSIKLYWKGTVSAHVTSVRSTLPAGVTVTVLPAKYTRAELRTAQAKLLSSSGSDSPTITATGAKISRIGPVADGSGLEVAYADALLLPRIAPATTFLHAATGTTTTTTTAREYRTTSVDSSAEVTSGVPTATTYEPLAPPTSGRQNDTSPWFGGAGMRSPTNTYCSTGFGVKRRVDNRFAVLTAAHCANYAATGTYKDPQAEYVGTIVAMRQDRDVAVVIQRTDTASAGRVWFGPPTELSDSRAVSGAGTNVVGGLVCTSGASTGIHCSSRIESVGGTVRTSDGVLHTAIVKATRTTGSAAVGTGDSGGPVVAYDGSRVRAHGVIVSGASAVTCSSTPAITATCYKTVYYVDVKQVLADFSLTLLTAS